MLKAETLLEAWTRPLLTLRELRRLRIELTPVGRLAVRERIHQIYREEYPTEPIAKELRVWELFVLRELRDHSSVRADLVLVDCCDYNEQPYDQLTPDRQG